MLGGKDGSSVPSVCVHVMFVSGPQMVAPRDALRIAQFGDANSLMVSPMAHFLHLAVQVASGGWEVVGAYSEKIYGIHSNVDDLMEWIFAEHAKLSQTQEACGWEGSVWRVFSQEKGYGQLQIIYRGTGGAQKIEEVMPQGLG